MLYAGAERMDSTIIDEGKSIQPIDMPFVQKEGKLPPPLLRLR